MDAREFIRARNKMCESFGIRCMHCPLFEFDCDQLHTMQKDYQIEKMVKIVENWLHETQDVSAGTAVKCKDCVYHINKGGNTVFCTHIFEDMMIDDHCSFGRQGAQDED